MASGAAIDNVTSDAGATREQIVAAVEGELRLTEGAREVVTELRAGRAAAPAQAGR